MNIDLSLLHQSRVEEIDITGTYQIPESYITDQEIKGLSTISVKGLITRQENDDLELEDYIKCVIEGEMIIEDSISLEEVPYPFLIEYDDFLGENIQKDENTLDIFAFLWENIDLEVPLQFTKVSDLSKFQGDGWKLISEEDRHQENNPFNDLLKDFEEE